MSQKPRLPRNRHRDVESPGTLSTHLRVALFITVVLASAFWLTVVRNLGHDTWLELRKLMSMGAVRGWSLANWVQLALLFVGVYLVPYLVLRSFKKASWQGLVDILVRTKR